MRLIIRHFFLGQDVALGRTWEFHDYMAARQDCSYRLHVIGTYLGPQEDLSNRRYVIRRWSLPEPSPYEVWVIRGWNHPKIILAAVRARLRGTPILMWNERPGSTWEATNWRTAARIWLRELLLPVLFVPYRGHTIVLGTGQRAVDAFRRLSHGSPGRRFPYPNATADACLRHISRKEQAGPPLLLFVGNFSRTKAVDLIVSSCETLWRSGYRFRVRYVGRGPLRDMIARHVGHSEGRAELYPFADRFTLLKHYQEANAVLLPSRRDGWGLPVHEGLASGIPVIASDACGAAELVEQSGCGRVVRADDPEALNKAISWVIELKPQERKHPCEKALSIAEQLTIPKLSNRLLSYCHEALELYSANTLPPTK